MIYVDTNILISYINPRDSLHEEAINIIRKLRNEKLIISKITVLELYTVFSRIMNISDEEIEALVEYTIKKARVNIEDIDLGELVTIAIEYSNKLKLKTLDLLHVVAAKLLNANSIATFDKDIIKKAKIIEQNLGLKIIAA